MAASATIANRASESVRRTSIPYITSPLTSKTRNHTAARAQRDRRDGAARIRQSVVGITRSTRVTRSSAARATSGERASSLRERAPTSIAASRTAPRSQRPQGVGDVQGSGPHISGVGHALDEAAPDEGVELRANLIGHVRERCTRSSGARAPSRGDRPYVAAAWSIVHTSSPVGRERQALTGVRRGQHGGVVEPGALDGLGGDVAFTGTEHGRRLGLGSRRVGGWDAGGSTQGNSRTQPRSFATSLTGSYLSACRQWPAPRGARQCAGSPAGSWRARDRPGASTISPQRRARSAGSAPSRTPAVRVPCGDHSRAAYSLRANNFPSPCSGNQRGAATTKGRIARTCHVHTRRSMSSTRRSKTPPSPRSSIASTNSSARPGR